MFEKLISMPIGALRCKTGVIVAGATSSAVELLRSEGRMILYTLLVVMMKSDVGSEAGAMRLKGI